MSLITATSIRDSVELVKRTVAKGATDQELELFIRQCERTGLDPFARQIYAIKRWDPSVGAEVMQTQVSIDGLRTIASETKQFAGEDGPYWCGQDGAWRDVWLSEQPPKASKVTVFRAGHHGTATFTGVALYDSYCQRRKDGTPTRMWAQMGPEMLAKCAEALALRKAFPQGLSGLYTSDEMGQADNYHQPGGIPRGGATSSPQASSSPREGKSSQSPPEGPQSPSPPSDDESPMLPPPNAAESHTGASEGQGAPVAVRDAVSGAFGRLTQAQRSTVFQKGSDNHLTLPDDPAFKTKDANSWMEIIAEVKA